MRSILEEFLDCIVNHLEDRDIPLAETAWKRAKEKKENEKAGRESRERESYAKSFAVKPQLPLFFLYV